MFVHIVYPIWHIDRILSGVTIPTQSEPESNGKEELFHITQGWRLTIRLLIFISSTLVAGGTGVLPLGRDANGIIYSRSRLGKHILWVIIDFFLFEILNFLTWGNIINKMWIWKYNKLDLKTQIYFLMKW